MPGQSIASSLGGSPYTIDATGQHALAETAKFQERTDLLGERGRLTDRRGAPTSATSAASKLGLPRSR